MGLNCNGVLVEEHPVGWGVYCQASGLFNLVASFIRDYLLVLPATSNLPQFPLVMSPRRLYEIDGSSNQFPDQLYLLLHDKEYVDCLQQLPDDELTQVVDHLDHVGPCRLLAKYY